MISNVDKNVILIKNIRLNVLLTTHSPNLMLALNVHAKKAGIVSDSHFTNDLDM